MLAIIPFRDGRIDEIESGLTKSVWVERQIWRPVVKVLNTIPSKALMVAGLPLEVEIVSLSQLLETIPRQKKSSLNSLIESDSILLTPEQSLHRGGNNLDLLFTAPIRRRRNFGCG